MTIGILISVVFLYLAFRKINFNEMVSAMGQANYWYLIPAAVFLFLTLWLRAYRWGIFFRPLKPMRMKNLLSALFIGYMANNILPFKLGEFLRAYSVGKSENFSKVASFATVVLERILDAISLLIVLGITFFFQSFPSYVKSSGLIILLVSLTAVLFLIFAVIKTDGTLRFYRKVAGSFPRNLADKGEKILRSLIDGLLILKKPQYYFIICITTAAIWIFYILIFQMFIYAFNFQTDYRLPLLASTTVFAVTSISVTVPSSPGYVGTYHYLVMLGLAIYHVPSSEAFSYAVLIHLFNMLPVTVLGLYYFMKQQLTMQVAYEEKQIRDQAKEEG